MSIFKKLFGDKVSYDGEKVTAPEDKKRLGFGVPRASGKLTKVWGLVGAFLLKQVYS